MNSLEQEHIISNEGTHISAIQFSNQSWTGVTFKLFYSYKEWSGLRVIGQMDTGNLYLGQSKTITFEKISPDSTGSFCVTEENGIRVDSAYNSDICTQQWVLDPNANLCAIYRATGSEFKLKLEFEKTKPDPIGSK